MSSILDNFVKFLIAKKIDNKDKINKVINHIKIGSKKINEQSINKFEIEKNKLGLKKKYYELGKFVSERFLKDKVSDFSYEEKYIELNKEIEKIRKYIKSLNEYK